MDVAYNVEEDDDVDITKQSNISSKLEPAVQNLMKDSIHSQNFRLLYIIAPVIN